MTTPFPRIGTRYEPTQLPTAAETGEQGQPPVAEFTQANTTGHIMQFTNLSVDPDGLIVSYLWDFGDVAAAVPIVALNLADTITQVAAHLSGTVTPKGRATTAKFQYGLTTAYGTDVTITPAPGSGSTAVAVSLTLTGLTAGTTYHFRLSATNATGTAVTVDGSFTTVATGAPIVTVTAPTGVSQTGATLTGTVNPQGLSTTAQFQYGLTTAYGTDTAVQTKTGASQVPLTQAIAGLAAGTSYHVRVSASNANGTTVSADRVFVTRATNGRRVMVGTFRVIPRGTGWPNKVPFLDLSMSFPVGQDLLSMLDRAEAAGACIMARPIPGDNNLMKNPDGSFSIQLTTDAIDRFWTGPNGISTAATVNGLNGFARFRRHVSIGTMRAFNLFDDIRQGEPNQFPKNPDGTPKPRPNAFLRPPTFIEIEAVVQHVKEGLNLNYIACGARVPNNYLRGLPPIIPGSSPPARQQFTYLDFGTGQYRPVFDGNAAAYVAKEVSDGVLVGLATVGGYNISKQGCTNASTATSNATCTGVGGDGTGTMTPAEIREIGLLWARNSGVAGIVNWAQYSTPNLFDPGTAKGVAALAAMQDVYDEAQLRDEGPISLHTLATP